MKRDESLRRLDGVLGEDPLHAMDSGGVNGDVRLGRAIGGDPEYL